MIQALEMKLRGLLKHINPRRSKYSVIVKTISKPNESEKVWGVDFIRSKHNQKQTQKLLADTDIRFGSIPPQIKDFLQTETRDTNPNAQICNHLSNMAKTSTVHNFVEETLNSAVFIDEQNNETCQIWINEENMREGLGRGRIVVGGYLWSIFLFKEYVFPVEVTK